MALISIVVPVYDVELFLAECLQSIARQTEPDLEVIVVDDGSCDGSRAIAERFADLDPRFRVIAQANHGSGTRATPASTPRPRRISRSSIATTSSRPTPTPGCSSPWRRRARTSHRAGCAASRPRASSRRVSWPRPSPARGHERTSRASGRSWRIARPGTSSSAARSGTPTGCASRRACCTRTSR